MAVLGHLEEGSRSLGGVNLFHFQETLLLLWGLEKSKSSSRQFGLPAISMWLNRPWLGHETMYLENF